MRFFGMAAAFAFGGGLIFGAIISNFLYSIYGIVGIGLVVWSSFEIAKMAVIAIQAAFFPRPSDFSRVAPMSGKKKAVRKTTKPKADQMSVSEPLQVAFVQTKSTTKKKGVKTL